MFKKALDFRDSHFTEVDTFDEFKDVLEKLKQDLFQHIGMALLKPNKRIKELTKATIRCIPMRIHRKKVNVLFR
jgi:prolyl-tRNA synthetase